MNPLVLRHLSPWSKTRVSRLTVVTGFFIRLVDGFVEPSRPRCPCCALRSQLIEPSSSWFPPKCPLCLGTISITCVGSPSHSGGCPCIPNALHCLRYHRWLLPECPTGVYPTKAFSSFSPPHTIQGSLCCPLYRSDHYSPLWQQQQCVSDKGNPTV